MLAWLIRRARALRNWLFVRLRIWRGRWRRGRVRVPGVRFLPGHLPLRTWRYGLYAPGGLRDDESAPLVVVLHGCKQRALSFAYAAGWMDFADSARVRLLCPDQRRLANFFRCWNWFHPSAQSGQGELAVVAAMIDDAAKRVRVDENAVAAIGMSAGGALAALLAFHSPRRFRAVVTVAAAPLLGRFSVQNPHGVMQRGVALDPLLALGTRRESCAPLAIIHGSADDVVHPRCAEQLLAQAVESFRRTGRGAAPGATVEGAAGAMITDYRADGELLLRRIDVQGMGHAWTGGPGGHRYCERSGAPLTTLCGQFLRDVGMLGQSPLRLGDDAPEGNLGAMPKILKISLIALGGLVGLIVIALAIIAATFDANAYKPQLIELVQQKKQRTLAIPGRIKLSFFPSLGAELGTLSISEHRSSATFASVESARVSLAVLPLLRKEFVVDRIQVDGLRAKLKRYKDGRTNIDDLIGPQQQPAPAQKGEQQDTRFDIGGVSMSNSVLAFDDEREGRRYEIAVTKLRTGRIAPQTPGEIEVKAHLKASQPALDAALDLKGGYLLDAQAQRYKFDRLKAELNGTLDKAPLAVTLDVPQLTIDKDITAQKIEARIKQTQGTRTIDARLSLPSFSGTRQALRTTLALAVDGKQGSSAIQATANGNLSVNLDKKSAALDLAGKLDQSGFTAKLWLDKFSPLALRFDVALDRLDVDRYRSTAPAPAQAKAAPETPIDLSALKNLNASGSLRVGALQVAGLKASDLQVDLRAANGRVDLAPLNAKLYQGSTSGSLSVLATSPPRFAVKQTLAGVSLGPLLKDLTGKEPVEGRGRLTLDVSTQGALVSALKKGLAGSARVELRDGAVRGVNIGQIVRIAKGTGTGSAADKTDFSEMSASFRIAGGVAHSDDLLATSPLMRLTGSGDVDVGNDRLDFLVKATVTGADIAALRGKTVPVRLRGPFASIGYSVDVGGLAQEAVKEKLEKGLGEKLKGLFGR